MKELKKKEKKSGGVKPNPVIFLSPEIKMHPYIYVPN